MLHVGIAYYPRHKFINQNRRTKFIHLHMATWQSSHGHCNLRTYYRKDSELGGFDFKAPLCGMRPKIYDGSVWTSTGRVGYGPWTKLESSQAEE